jgi:hypothetical protein
MGHAAVDTDVLACDEARLVGTKIEHHVCNIQGITHTPGWLLYGVWTLVATLAPPHARLSPYYHWP